MPECSKEAAEFEKKVKEAKTKLLQLKGIIQKEGKNIAQGKPPNFRPIGSGIPLKFPHTFTAKVIQFPWKFYVRNNWIWTSYVFGVLTCIPIFKWISNGMNSEANVKKWEDQKRKEAEQEQHH